MNISLARSPSSKIFSPSWRMHRVVSRVNRVRMYEVGEIMGMEGLP
jgi:hypothetical protein